MAVTVRRRLPRFDAGGFAVPAGAGLSAGGGGAGGLISSAPYNGNQAGNAPSTPSPSFSPSGGGNSWSGAGWSGAGGTLNPNYNSQGSWQYSPGQAIPGGGTPPQSDAFTATAQGLPKASSKGGFNAGPQSTQWGSWGGGTQDQNITGGAGYQPSYNPAASGQWNYIQPNTAGNYNVPYANITAPQAPSQRGGGWSALVGSPNYAASGGAIPEFLDGGSVPSYRRGGAHHGDVNMDGTSDYRSPQQQQHDFEQADTVGQINKYYSQQKPLQDAIQAGRDADKLNAQLQQPQQQQQQRQPQQRQQRQPMQQSQPQGMQMPNPQRMRDATLARALQQGTGGQNPFGSTTANAPATGANTSADGGDALQGSTSADAVQAGAGMAGLATGGAVPEFYGGGVAAQPAQRTPHSNVKAAFSHARAKNGLNDQIFQQMAGGLTQKFDQGGPVGEDIAAEDFGGGVGMEDLASEDLPYKVGPGPGQEDLKGEAEDKYLADGER